MTSSGQETAFAVMSFQKLQKPALSLGKNGLSNKQTGMKEGLRGPYPSFVNYYLL